MGVSNSKSSGSESAKKGGDWTYKLYFDPEADQSTGKSYTITDSELMEKLTNLVDVDEEIIYLCAHKQDLYSWQLTKLVLYHVFVEFETNSWWWSIEKNSEGITIQRSLHRWAVYSQYRQESRLDRTLMKEDKGKKTMKELIEWLYRENELNKKYDYISSNCKHFAKAVFDYVAAKKCL